MKEPLSTDQKEIYEFLCDYIERYKISPTQKEVANLNGMSVANVNRFLRILKRKGWIDKSNKRQSIVIL